MRLDYSDFVGAVTVAIPMRGFSGEYVGYNNISNSDTEIQIFSSFGKEGTTIEVCIYVIDPVTANKAKPFIGDLMYVWIKGVRRGRIGFVVSEVRLEDTNGDENWRLQITGEVPLFYVLRHCEMNGTIDLGKSTNYGNAIAKMIKTGLDQHGLHDEEFRVVYNGDKAPKTFDSLFCFNESVAKVIDHIAHEMGLEYYYSPFASELYMGAPTPSDENNDIGGVDALAATGHHCRYGVKGPDGKIIDVYDVVMPGQLIILPGAMVGLNDGFLYKAVEASYYANGNNEREQHVKLVKSEFICDDIFMALLNDQAIHSSYPAVNELVKVVDVFPNDKSDRDPSHGKYMAYVAPKDTSKQDSGAWDFSDEILMSPLTRTTPYAGDGVGLLFPKVTKSRALVFTPNKHFNHSYVGPMTWKEGEGAHVVPNCGDKDFLLRLSDGYLYFDEANKTWLLRAEHVKMEGAAPVAAGTKPDTTPASGTYIKVNNDGSVVVHGTTVNVQTENIGSINLGGNAAKKIALADHVHVITVPIIGPGGTTTGTCGAPNSVTTKTMAE